MRTVTFVLGAELEPGKVYRSQNSFENIYKGINRDDLTSKPPVGYVGEHPFKVLEKLEELPSVKFGGSCKDCWYHIEIVSSNKKAHVVFGDRQELLLQFSNLEDLKEELEYQSRIKTHMETLENLKEIQNNIMELLEKAKALVHGNKP